MASSPIIEDLGEVADTVNGILSWHYTADVSETSAEESNGDDLSERILQWQAVYKDKLNKKQADKE